MQREHGRNLMQSYDKHPLTTDSASQNYIKALQKASPKWDGLTCADE